MPIDLFEKYLDQKNGSDNNRSPVDLFQNNQNTNLNKSFLDKLANSAPVNFVLGGGDSLNNQVRGALDLFPGINIRPVESGQGTSYDVGKYAGDVSGFLLGGEGLDTARLASSGIPYIGKLASSLSGDGLNGIARRAIGSGIYGAVQDPNDKTSSAIESGLASALLDSALGGISKLAPSKIFRGTATPEEIKKNYDVSQGTNTNLAEIVRSPTFKKIFENTLPSTFLTNSDSVMGNLRDQIVSRGTNLFSDISKGVSGDNQKYQIQQALSDAKNNAQQKSDVLYKNLSDLASQNGVKIGRDNFSSTAKSILDNINKSDELKRELSPSIINDIQAYSGNVGDHDLNITNIFKGILGEKANDFYRNGKRYESGLYSRLRNSLQADMDQAFKNSGDPQLGDLYKQAQSYYKNNVVPFQDKDISAFTIRGGDTDKILSQFIKAGQNDRGNLLSKLMNNLPEESKNLVGSAYFSNALDKNGSINPLKMKSLYDKLGESQKTALLNNPELKSKLDDYSSLVEMNREPLTNMFNPKTGSRNTGAINTASQILTGILSGDIARNGGLSSQLAAGLGSTFLPSGVARYLNNTLTSPEFRKKIVDKITTDQDKSIYNNKMYELLRSLAIPGISQNK